MEFTQRGIERVIVIGTYAGMAIFALYRGQYELAGAWITAAATYTMARLNGSRERE